MTEGQRALREVLRTTPEREVARRCRVSQPAVSLWSGGKRRPELHPRISLEQEFGIPLLSWDREVVIAADSEPEQPRRARATAC